MSSILAFASQTRKPGDPVIPSGPEQITDSGIELHVLSIPMRVLGLYYVRCGCSGGWVSEGQDSERKARQQVCAFERASLEAEANLVWFERAVRSR